MAGGWVPLSGIAHVCERLYQRQRPPPSHRPRVPGHPLPMNVEYIIEILKQGDGGKKAIAELEKLAQANAKQGRTAKTAATDNAKQDQALKSTARSAKAAATGYDQLAAGVKRALVGYLSLRTGIDLVRSSFEKANKAVGIQNLFDVNLGKRATGVLTEFRREADRIGVVALDLQQGFGKFNAAAKSSNLTLGEQREVFLSITEAARTLNLSQEQTGRIFTALEQMVSSGTVRMEELGQQLKDSLPGSFQIAADSIGVTTGELRKLLEQGKLATEDFILPFARAIRSNFPLTTIATQSAAAELARLKNAWDEFLVTLGNGLPFQNLLNNLTKVARGVNQLTGNISLDTLEAQFNRLPNTGAARAEFFAERFPFAPRLDEDKLLQRHPELFRFNATPNDRPFNLLPYGNAQEGEFQLRDFRELERILSELNRQGALAADKIKQVKEATQKPTDSKILAAQAQGFLDQAQFQSALRAASGQNPFAALQSDRAGFNAAFADIQAGGLLPDEQIHQAMVQVDRQLQVRLAALSAQGQQAMLEAAVFERGQEELLRLQIDQQFEQRRDAVAAYYAFRREQGQLTTAELAALHAEEANTFAQLQAQQRAALQETNIIFTGMRDIARTAFADMTRFGAQAFVSLFRDGKLEVRQFFAELLGQIAQAIIQMAILAAFKRALGGSVIGGFLGLANGGFALNSNSSQLSTPRRAAAGLAGVATVSSPTVFPNFNVLAGEAGAEMLTVLSRPKLMSVGGHSLVTGMAQGQPLSIIDTRSLASLIPAANGLTTASGMTGGGAGVPASQSGRALVEVRLAPGLEGRITENSVAAALVRVTSEMQQDTDLRRATRTVSDA